MDENNEEMTLCDACNQEVSIDADFTKCEECGIEGCESCVQPRGSSDGRQLCETCEADEE